jgi:glycosyltransferase involved in cell wall biosynthesis
MKISIITVNLNNKIGLDKTIQSISEQTWQEFEYIIIDGGSNDGSVQVIEHFNLTNCTWVSESDNGIYQAMNKGIVRANGDYLLFLNSGDTLYSNKTLEEILPDLQTGEDIIYGNAWFIKEEKQWEEKFPATLSFQFFYLFTLNHQSTFIKKQLFYDYGFYAENIRINADWAFFIKVIFQHNASCKHITKIISIFTHDGISSQPENIELIRKERKEILETEFKYFINDYQLFTYITTNRRVFQFLHIRQHKIAFAILKVFMSFLLLFLPKIKRDKYSLPKF